jgi:hypothetical protein
VGGNQAALLLLPSSVEMAQHGTPDVHAMEGPWRAAGWDRARMTEKEKREALKLMGGRLASDMKESRSL